MQEAMSSQQERSRDLVALKNGLSALGKLDPRKCKAVDLRHFGGLSRDEIAEALDVSPVTVQHSADRVKQQAQKMYQAASLAEAERAFRHFKGKWQRASPGMVRRLEKDLPELRTCFRFPRHLWRKLRTTNVIERCFVEVRRRTRSLACSVNVESADRIIYAIFNGYSQSWRDSTLRSLRKQLDITMQRSCVHLPVRAAQYGLNGSLLPCPSQVVAWWLARPFPTIASSKSSVAAGWVWSIRPRIPSSAASWRSSSCRHCSGGL